MLNLIKAELNIKGALSKKLPTTLQHTSSAIFNNGIPERMKMTIAMSELILYASHFRRNIEHWNGSFIPINAITFSISASGTGKDSAVSAVRKCFTTGYSKLEIKRKQIAKDKAIQAAAADGTEDPNSFETYKAYYKAPNPLFVAPSTVEGFIQHLNDLDNDGTGAGFIYSGEFGSELVSSGVIQSNLQLLAELYDEGSKEVKVLKARENQSKEIKNLPVSALFAGSQANILFDENIKRIFIREFSTKLARRSIFNFSPETVPPEKYASVNLMLAAELREEEASKAVRLQVDAFISEVTDYQLQRIGKPIKVSLETRELFTLYKRYNQELSDIMPKQYAISQLVRLHMQWKALKIAGAIAFYKKHETIELDDYIEAISFVETLDEDMQKFEVELVKEPYEQFVAYMHSIVKPGIKTIIGLHHLRKLGYIPMTGKPETRMKELVQLASSYDPDGIYTIITEGICFEPIIKTEYSGISYLKVTGTKDERAKNCSTGYTYGEFTFGALGQMLQGDFAYSPFKFTDGIRSKDTVEGGCKWVCLDIDKSSITDIEAHQILSNFNHHIVRTSDKTNEFKFRILLELDSMVDIPDKIWKSFIKSIAAHLSLDADLLPKAQIFFSYADRTVYSVTDKHPLEVKEHLLYAYNYAEAKPDISKLPRQQRSAMLDDTMETFDYAYDAEQGGRSLALIRAAKHAKDLGADKPFILQLMRDINDYWVTPLDEERLKNTILSQIERW